MRRRAALALAAAALVAARGAAAQGDPLARAFELERRGNDAAAVDAYRTALRAAPGELSALLGLERSLAPLNRGGELLPDLQLAMGANPKSSAVYGVALRYWGAQGQADSLRRIAERWAALEPGEETPYREWAAALAARRDRAGARTALLAGREKLGRPDALAAELAQLAAQEGDWPQSLREWLAAARRLPGYRASALSALRQAPEAQRPALLAQLGQDPSPVAKRFDAELRARWGDPLGGYERLQAALPAEPAQAVDVLRQFAEALRGQPGAPARAAMGRTLEAIAERTGGTQAARLRLDAVQAYLDGGDRASARRLLASVAGRSDVPPALSASASGLLLRLLVEEGRMDEAERRLADAGNTLTADERAEFTRRVALGWARQGQLDRAGQLVANDSSVEGLSLRGRLALFRGRVGAARTALGQAGPYAGSREDATARTALLALLQPIEADTLPALGAAFLALERGDTSAAVDGLDAVGRALPPAKGGAELRVLAGRLAAAQGRVEAAERILRAVPDSAAPAASAAALLELGRLYVLRGRTQDAVPLLEQLILQYPRSALVPQARRALDEARGAVPGT